MQMQMQMQSFGELLAHFHGRRRFDGFELAHMRLRDGQSDVVL
nr:hypothetical protein [Pseudomonas fluorescens]